MPPLRLSRSASLALSALLLLPVGCTDTGEGYGVIGLNESSRDVIVTLQTSNGGSFLLKAGTWGTVAASFGPRKGDIVVSRSRVQPDRQPAVDDPERDGRDPPRRDCPADGVQSHDAARHSTRGQR